MAGIADLAVQGSNRDGDPINTGEAYIREGKNTHYETRRRFKIARIIATDEQRV